MLQLDRHVLRRLRQGTITRNAASGLPEQVSDGSMQINRSFNGYGEIDATENSSGFSYNLTRN
jgi:hypothetical protein